MVWITRTVIRWGRRRRFYRISDRGQKVGYSYALRITRAVNCPVTADIEAGYGDTIEEVLQMVKAIIEAGAVGINIEDSTKGQARTLVDVPLQVEILKAIRQLAESKELLEQGTATKMNERAISGAKLRSLFEE